MWGGARCVDYRVLNYVSMWARHTSPSTYQHDPSDQVGASADTTFGQLSIYGATRRVLILIRLGDLLDPEVLRLCIYVERAVEFPARAKVLPPSVGGQADLPIMG